MPPVQLYVSITPPELGSMTCRDGTYQIIIITTPNQGPLRHRCPVLGRMQRWLLRDAERGSFEKPILIIQQLVGLPMAAL